jgi:hypothetical protein
MAACGYSVNVGADISLAANVTQSILGVKSGAAFGLIVKKLSLGSRASGSTAPTAIPLLVEVCYCTWATNSPGTASTSETPSQTYGRVLAHGTTAASAWSTEPTALTVLDEFALHPQQGYKEAFPLGEEFDCDLAHGFVIRVTNPTTNPTVIMRPSLHWERI